MGKRKCTLINPETIGIILDRNKYKAQLFINHQYLKPAEIPKLNYIESSHAILGISTRRNLFIKSLHRRDSEETLTELTLNNISSISHKAIEMKMLSTISLGFNRELNQTKPSIYKIHKGSGNYRTYEHLFSIGTVSSNGSFLLPSQNVLGFHVQKDQTLTMNPHIQYGTPIQINVSDPSIVEVVRDNVVIYSKFYPPGNYYLDTKSFDSGVYNIYVKITTLTGKVKTKHYVFIKKIDYPAMGSANYDFMVGFAPNTKNPLESVLPAYMVKPVIKGSYSWRLSKKSSIEVTSISDIDYTAGVIELYRFGRSYQTSYGIALGSDGGIGASFTSALIPLKNMAINFQSRYIYDKHSKKPFNAELLSSLDLMQKTQANFSLGISYMFSKNTISSSMSYDYYMDIPDVYEYTIRYSRPLFEKLKFKGDLSINNTWSNQSFALYATVTIRLTGKTTSHALSLIGDHTTVPEQFHQGLNYKFNYDVTDDLKVGAIVDVKREPTLKIQNFAKEIASTYTVQAIYQPMNLQTHFVKQHLADHTYAHLMNITINGTWGGIYSYKNGFATTTDMLYNSGTFIRVESPVKESKFNVVINNNEAKIIKANKNYFYALPPLMKQKIQISSTSEEHFFKINNVPDYLLLYPSNIAPIIASAKEFFILMTVIVDEKDIPIANASIKLHEEFDDNTDEFGETQIEVSQGDKVKVTDKENKECYFVVPNEEAEGGVLIVDKLVCTTKNIT